MNKVDVREAITQAHHEEWARLEYRRAVAARTPYFTLVPQPLKYLVR